MLGGDLFSATNANDAIRLISKFHTYFERSFHEKYILIGLLDIIGNMHNCLHLYTNKDEALEIKESLAKMSKFA
jgi:hypothetical protein